MVIIVLSAVLVQRSARAATITHRYFTGQNRGDHGLRANKCAEKFNISRLYLATFRFIFLAQRLHVFATLLTEHARCV